MTAALIAFPVFVFVKLPQGWRFVGKTQVTAAELSQASVVRDLLQGTGGPGAVHPMPTE